jgi:hypothetical protein
VSWRKWIDKFGSSLPVLPQPAADLPPMMTREQVFDWWVRRNRLLASTLYCSDCKRFSDFVACLGCVRACMVPWRNWFGSNLPVLLSRAADLPPMMTREQVFDSWVRSR